jgi:long-chain fatty acid transport protein
MFITRAGARLGAAVLAVAVLAGKAYGAGFALQDFDGKALGMSNAFAATADNPSAVFFNPAGMTQIPHALAGEATITLVNPHQSFDADPGEGANAHGNISVLPVPAFFGVVGITDWLYLGVGSWVPFGLAIDWGDKWSGRYVIDEASIEVDEYNGNLAIKIPFGENAISIAGGLSIITAKARFKRNIDQRAVGAPDGYTEIQLGTNDDFVNWRWNVAGLLSLLDGKVRFGVQYRDGIHDLTLRGRAEFVNLAPPIRAQIPRASKSRASTPLPGEVRLGLAIEPIEDLTIEADYKWTNWSVVSDIPVKFRRTNGHIAESILKFDFEDASFVALGAEYRLVKDFLALRAGGYWDKTPANRDELSPALPDNDRYGFSLGIGLTPTKNIFIDFAYLAVFFKDVRKDNAIGTEPPNLGTPRGNGRYETFANLFTLTLGLQF